MFQTKVTTLLLLVIVLAAGAFSAGAEGFDISEFQRFTSPPPVAEAHYGHAIAIDNDILVVGAKDDDSGAVRAGAAYIYRFVDGQWVFDTQLIASDIEDFQMFGYSVAIDDDVIAIGSKSEDEHLGKGKGKGGTIVHIGAVYIYRYNGQDWIEEQRIITSDFFRFDEFGSAVDIEGDRLLVGAHQEGTACDGDGAPYEENCNSGAAYVFEYNGEEWFETAKIVPDDTHVRDLFGATVDLQGDVAVIGSWPNGNTAGPCPPACSLDGHGAAYIYRYNGKNWNFETKFVPPGGGELFDYFGFSFKLDGTRLIVGAEGDAEFEIGGGAAFIYEYDPKAPELWVLQQKLVPSDIEFVDHFGQAVTIDGDILVIGANFKDIDDITSAGAAYIFTFDGNVWTEQVKLVPSDPEAWALFGFRVLLNDSRLVSPAIAVDTGKSENAGAAYSFLGLSDCNNNNQLDLIDIDENISSDENNNGIPDECEGVCPWDLDKNGSVGTGDLLALFAQWGTAGSADFDRSGEVGTGDLLILFANWGPCP